MKRLVISEIFPPVHGGSGRWFWELYSRLPTQENCLAVGQSAKAEDFDKNHDLNVHRLNLSSSEWGVKSLDGLKFYWKTFWALRQIVKKEQVSAIHCGRCIPEGVVGLLLSYWFGLPLICYIHGEDVETAAKSREHSLLVKQVFKRSSKLICNSKNTARLLAEKWRVQASKIAILHPGVDAHKFVPNLPAPSARAKLNWGDRPVLLTVGRLQKRKGHDVLIRAVKELITDVPNILYCIVGDGLEKVALEKLVAELNLTNNVLFMSEISDDLMLTCYQQCDIFILPNRTIDNDIEGFGMVLVEAQSCGKPVIAGDSGGTAETMLVEKSGLVLDCTSPTHLVREINKLLANPDKIKEMGAAGREHVLTNLDWQAHVIKAKQIFEQAETL